MQFFRRNRYPLLAVAVILFAAILVVQQFQANQAAHTQRVEEFLLLHERGETEPCAHRYQMLVQRLPHLNDRLLTQDLLRTALLVDLQAPPLDNLIWKYHVSVRNELKQRAEKRLAKPPLPSAAKA